MTSYTEQEAWPRKHGVKRGDRVRVTYEGIVSSYGGELLGVDIISSPELRMPGIDRHLGPNKMLLAVSVEKIETRAADLASGTLFKDRDNFLFMRTDTGVRMLQNQNGRAMSSMIAIDSTMIALPIRVVTITEEQS